MYAAYWAFNIRRALKVRIYRNQALGVGFLSLGWIILFIDFVVISPISYLAFVMVFSLVSGMFFYFIDASVLDGRMSDPLLRDSLHWRRIRKWVWGIFVASAAMSISLTGYYQIVTAGNISLFPSWMYTGAFLYIDMTLVAGLLLLPITAVRSRDPLLRRQLAWFGGFVCAIAIVAVGNESSATGQLPELWVFALLFAASFCLYKSARSLAPLNRLPRIEPEMSPLAREGAS